MEIQILYPNDKGWKDTVLVNPNETVQALVKFNDYSGRYLLHCHNLEHEDDGMMLNIKIDAPTKIDDEDLSSDSFQLHQNYPNPFNPSTTISYQIPSAVFVTLKVFDAIGNQVASLVNEPNQAGNYKVSFEAQAIPSGVYHYRLKAGEFVETRKMILFK